MNPTISIVMPVYNVEKYLRECLDSVRAQTFTDWECICVDDGSTDASPAILDEYAKKDARFKIYRREHTNAGAARNAGMDHAKGEFLSFLDSDDVFAPTMLEILHLQIQKHQADIVTCAMVKFRDGERLPAIGGKRLPIEQVYENPARTVDTFRIWVGRPWDKMFRKAHIASLGLRFQEIRSTNDEFFVDVAIVSAKRLVHVPAPLIAYRQHALSLQSTQHKDPLCVIKAIEAIHETLDRKGFFGATPTLSLHFRAWALRASRQMRRFGDYDAFATFHHEMTRLCSQYRLGELTQENLQVSADDYDWFRTLCNGATPERTLWAEVVQLRRELEALRPLRGIDRTYAYRIGRVILWLPKHLMRLLKSFR